MDPIFEQLVSELRTSFDAQKAAQQAVQPLQQAAADATRALDQGNAAVTATVADVDAKIKALEGYVENGTVPTVPGGDNNLPSGGGGDQPMTGRRPIAKR